jgi:hypothetical protein
MGKLHKAHECLISVKGISDGLLRFVKFDRFCRIQQYNFGWSWGEAFDAVAFTKVLVEAELASAKQSFKSASVPYAANAASAQSARVPRRVGHCFHFWDKGRCDLEGSCLYASSHKCFKCNSVEHGTGQCRVAGQSVP